jgi:hypothetical protein
MSRKIKALGVKMVLSGEGSDEVFGGYLYFHKAPSKVCVVCGMCVGVQHVCGEGGGGEEDEGAGVVMNQFAACWAFSLS